MIYSLPSGEYSDTRLPLRCLLPEAEDIPRNVQATVPILRLGTGGASIFPPFGCTNPSVSRLMPVFSNRSTLEAHTCLSGDVG